jgi:HK97 family phage major capsid protein
MHLPLLDRLRSQREDTAKAIEAIYAAVEERAAKGEGDALTDGEAKNAADLDATLKALDERIAPMAAILEREGRAAKLAATVSPLQPSPLEVRSEDLGGAKVKSEPRTYVAGGQSWLLDVFNRSRHQDAAERLERRQREFDLEERASTTTTFNGLVPPQYLLNMFAGVLRAGRVTPDLAMQMALPPVGMSAILTRGTTGTVAAVQATQNTNASLTDMVTADLTIPVVTIAGGSDVSRQTAERGGVNIDQQVILDVAADYARILGQQSLFGTGASGQALGIENTAGIIAVTVAVTGVTAATGLLPGLANAIQQINTQRFQPANAIIMHPRRWGALTIALDTANRPIVQVDGPGFNAVGGGAAAQTSGSTGGAPSDSSGVRRVGSLLGLDVYADPNIRTNQGAGTNEDSVIVCRREDMYVWENNGGQPETFSFDQVSGPATIRLAVYGNFAFSAGRFPVGFARLSGVGLVPPTF